MKKWMNVVCSLLMVAGLVGCDSKPSEEHPPQTPAEAPKPSTPPAETPAPATPPAGPGGASTMPPPAP